VTNRKKRRLVKGVPGRRLALSTDRVMNKKLKAILTELRHRFEVLYGPRLTGIVLYGSHARGDAEPDSDIDVLVILEGSVVPTTEIHRTSEIVAGLSLKHDVVISCVFVERERALNEQSPLLLNVRREGIAV